MFGWGLVVITVTTDGGMNRHDGSDSIRMTFLLLVFDGLLALMLYYFFLHYCGSKSFWKSVIVF